MLRIGNEFSKLLTLEHGGQATVYRAWQESLQRYVALKSTDITDPKNIRLIIDHTRVISEKLLTDTPAIFDCFIESKRVWTVMEFIDGLSLDKIHLKDWSVDVKLHIMWRVAGILHKIHCDGLIHGDLKPGNIMITRKGFVKLVDFGMSLDRNSECQPLLLQGTLSYIAPEKKIQGEAGKPSIDIFSFGIILYEILNGQRPKFTGMELAEPLKWSDNIPRAIKELINSCIASFPDLRPKNFATIRDAIKKELYNYVNNSYEILLTESIEPEFCRYMAEKCMSAAEEVMKKNRLLSYTFLCEALEWDPDFSPVINALERFPPVKKHRVRANRSLVFLIASFCVVFIGLGILGNLFKSGIPATPPVSPTSPVSPAVVYNPEINNHEEYIGGKLLHKPNAKNRIRLMAGSDNFRDSSQLILRKMPRDAIVYLDNKKVARGDSDILKIWVSSGDHELLAINENDTLFFEYFNILPFEKKMIDLNTKKENL